MKPSHSTLSRSPAIQDYICLRFSCLLIRLYWIEHKTGSVWSTGSDVTNHAVMVYSGKEFITGVAAHNGMIFMAKYANQSITVINESTKAIVSSMTVANPLGIVISGGQYQETFRSPCDIRNGDCEEFCFPQPPGNVRKCGCSIGLRLSANGTNCETDLIKGDFFIIADSDIRFIIQISADGSRYSRLNLPNVEIPVQVEFDGETKMVYWTDIGTKSVNTASWEGKNYKALATENVLQPTGLALDSISKNVYWTDEGTRTISVVKVDGTHRKTILTDNLKSPRGLTIDMFLGLMWWTDWTKQTIESAHLDGSHRKVIIDRSVDWPNGIAVDRNEKHLYWVDARSDAIYVSDLEGNNRREVQNFTKNAHTFGIAITEAHLYWTDWNEPSVMRIRKSKRGVNPEPFGPNIFSKICDIHFVPKELTIPVHHPCSKYSNNCTDMCIPVPEPSVVYGVDSMNKDLKGLCTCGKHINSECNASKRTAAPPVPTPPVTVTECQQNITVVAPHCEDSVLMNYSSDFSNYTSLAGARSSQRSRQLPSRLKEGTHRQKYQFKDLMGKVVDCQFYVIVEVLSCNDVNDYVAQFENLKVAYATCGNRFGSVVDLSCSDGLQLIGSEYLTCKMNGEWAGQATCVPEGNAGPSSNITGGKNLLAGIKMDLISLVIPIVMVIILIVALLIGYRRCRKTKLRFPRQQRHELNTISRDVEQPRMRSDTPRPSPHCATNRAFQEIEQNIITNANAELPTISTTATDRESNVLRNEAIYSEPEGSDVYATTSRSPSVLGARPT